MGAADPRRMVVSGTRASKGNILCSWVGNFSLFFCQSSLRREERFKLVNGIGGGHRGHAWEGGAGEIWGERRRTNNGIVLKRGSTWSSGQRRVTQHVSNQWHHRFNHHHLLGYITPLKHFNIFCVEGKTLGKICRMSPIPIWNGHTAVVIVVASILRATVCFTLQLLSRQRIISRLKLTWLTTVKTQLTLPISEWTIQHLVNSASHDRKSRTEGQ